MNRDTRGRLLQATSTVALLLFLSSGAAFAGTCTLSAASTWADGSSNWNNALNWSPNGVPNSSSTNVCIVDGSSSVTDDTSPSIASLQVGSGNTLTQSGGTLFVNGTSIANDGSIVLNGNVQLLNSVTVSGAGTVSMAGALVYQGAGGETLTNGSTIQGYGQLGYNALAVTNNATVNANASGQTLYMNGGGAVINTSILEATGGGTLQISNSVNNQTGTISADGTSTVYFNGGTIQGGTLTNASGGTIETNNTTLDGSTLGAIELSAGTTLTDIGTNFLTGQLTLDAGSNFQLNSNLQLTGNTTLAGTGTVTMAGAIVYQNVDGLSLTNGSTIQGYGQLGYNGLAVTNNATVNANASGQTLYMNGGGLVTNTSILEATGGGTLQISNTVNNQTGTISADGTSTVYFNGGTIQGGTLTNASGGTMETNNTTLDGSTLGAITLSAGTTLTDVDTTFLTGQITLDAGSNFQLNSNLQLTGNTALAGTGTVTMAGAIVYQNVAGLSLTNGSTIQGYGQLGYYGLAVTNNAIVNANVSGQTLYVNGGLFTNNSTLEATGGGTLQISTTVNNQTGTISADGTSTVYFNGGTIQGGTLTNASGGTMETNATLLDGSTLGAITLSAGTTLTDVDTTYLTGQLTLDAGSNFQLNSNLLLTTNATLAGTGTTTMAGAIVYQNAGGMTLTNQATIQGFGQLGYNGLALANQGTVTANVSGQTLYVNGNGTVDNSAGTLAAKNGGTMIVSDPLSTSSFSGGVLNGHYNVDGTGGNSTLQLSSLGSTGGEVTQIGDGTTSSGVTLDGTNASTHFVDGGSKDVLALAKVSANASLTLQNGYSLQTPGDLSNSGDVTIGGGGAPATLTVGAGGANTYNQSGAGSKTQVDGTFVAAMVDVAGGVLEGAGMIQGAVSNTGGTVKGGDSPGSLTVTGNYSQGGGGTLETQIAGTGAGSYDRLLVGGTAALAGTLDLELIDGFNFTTGDSYSFDILGTGDGLSNGLSGLVFDSNTCATDGPDMWKCTFGSFFDVFTELTLDPGVLVAGSSPQDLVLDVTQTATVVSSVPEPGTLALFGSGLVALFAARRRRKSPGGETKPRA